MTPSQEIRHECLLQLYGAGRLGATAEHVERVCRRQGFRYSLDSIQEALYFLAGQGLVEASTDPVTGLSRHRITSRGIIHWEQSET
jgi:Fe2+ or Zn2+ uptake regulation protein